MVIGIINTVLQGEGYGAGIQINRQRIFPNRAAYRGAVTRGSDLLISGVVAPAAGHICVPADLQTTDDLFCMINFIMPQGGDLLIGLAHFTPGAAGIGIPANLGTGGILSRNIFNIVSQQGNGVFFYVITAGAGVGSIAVGFAEGIDNGTHINTVRFRNAFQGDLLKAIVVDHRAGGNSDIMHRIRAQRLPNDLRQRDVRIVIAVGVHIREFDGAVGIVVVDEYDAANRGKSRCSGNADAAQDCGVVSDYKVTGGHIRALLEHEGGGCLLTNYQAGSVQPQIGIIDGFFRFGKV